MLLETDSFDHYATADIPKRWNTAYSIAPIQSITPSIVADGYRGTHAITWDGVRSSVPANPIATRLPAGYEGVGGFVGGRFKFDGSFGSINSDGQLVHPSAGRRSGNGGGCPFLFFFRGDGHMQVGVQLNRNGTLSIVVGDMSATTNPLDEVSHVTLTSVRALHIGVFHTIALSIDGISGASALDLVVDGETWIGDAATETMSTDPDASGFYDEVIVGRIVSAGRPGDPISMTLDDFYLTDADVATDPANILIGQLGGPIVIYAPPVADDVAQFTPLAGSDHFAQVDEATIDGDTTYNKSLAAADVDTYFTDDLPLSGLTILGMQAVYARRRVVGAATTRAVFRVGAVNYVGAIISASAAYLFDTWHWSQNPSTLASLVEADLPINGGGGNSVGVEHVA